MQYGGDAVHFDPGSSGVHILDPDTLEHRASLAPDLVRLVKVAEMLPQYDAQSTAVVCNEVPKEIGDLYRLYLVLLYSAKPVITGAFSTQTSQIMFDMLAILAGDRQALAQKPLAVFDVCPSPPLIWSNFGAQNLMDLAWAGAAAPVALLGSVVQHAAECLSGITLPQKITRKLFRQEQYLPSNVIDRGSIRVWQEGGSQDTLAQAKSRLTELLAAYERPSLPAEQERELYRLVTGLAREAGMAQLPEIE